MSVDKREVIEQVLTAQRNGQWNMSSAFGGAAGVSGGSQMYQADTNKAIEAWLKNDDPSGMQQLVSTMHITGALTDRLYIQIMKAIEGEK